MGSRRNSPEIKLNPLFMEPILEHILKQLPLEDLNNCVTVCKLWRKEAIRVYKQRQTVELHSQEDLLDFWEKLERRAETGSDFIVNRLDTKNLNLEDPIFEKVLNAIAPKLSLLIINDGRVTLKTLHKYLRMVPNLVRLEIGTVKMMYGEFSKYHQLFPIYISENSLTRGIFEKLKSLEYLSFNEPGTITPISSAMKTFPNLRSLTISNLSAQKYSNLDGIHMPHLEELNIHNFQGVDFEINEKHLKMLMRVKFDCLKTLKLVNLKKTIDAGVFRRFVEKHRETLTILEIRQLVHANGEDGMPELSLLRFQIRRMCMHQIQQGPYINMFPLDLPNLKLLRIDRSHVVSLPRIFSSMPSLEKLYLNFSSDCNWMSLLPKTLAPLPQLKELYFSWIEPKPMEILAKSFTGVVFLSINDCYDDVLHVVYENMPQLEYLLCIESKDRKMTPEGFTGIPSTKFSKAVKKSDNESDDNWTDDSDDDGNYRTKSFIGQLQNLKHVLLYFSNNVCAGKIFEFGLQEAPSLQTVTIDGLELEAGVTEYLEENGLPVFDFKALNTSKKMEGHTYIVYFCDIQEALWDFQTYGAPETESWLEILKKC